MVSLYIGLGFWNVRKASLFGRYFNNQWNSNKDKNWTAWAVSFHEFQGYHTNYTRPLVEFDGGSDGIIIYRFKGLEGS
jgi:hypothetical protein